MTSETLNFSSEEWSFPDGSTTKCGSDEAPLVHPSNHNPSISSSSSERNSPTPPTSNTSFVTSQVAVSVTGPYKYMPNNDDCNVRPLSRTNLQACSYESHVDITDTDAITTVSLHRCQDLVVSRYNSLLKLIGWKPFGKEHGFRHPRLWKVINVVYTGMVILLLVYSYTYTGFFCESQLHLRGMSVGKAQRLKVINLTTITPPTMPPTQTSSDLSDSYISFWPMNIFPTKAPSPVHNNTKNANNNCTADYVTIRSCHLITTCVIPSIIHALIYIYGFVHFRMKENEHLDALMERVFLQAQTTYGFQDKLIRNTRRFTWLAAVWVFLVVVLYGMSLVSFGLPHSTIYNHCSLPSYVSIILVSLDGVSELLTACICVAVVINFASQCEFLVHSIHYLCLQLHERQLDLKQAMREILGIRDQLSQLNGALAKMTSLCVLNFGVMFVIGFSLLIMNFELKAEQWVCRTIFLVCWLSILLVPVVQAARMTKMGEKLRQISFELRVFGYKSCSQLDLDSFILFVSNATLRTKLFSVPVKPAYLVSAAAITIFAILLLFQTDTIQTNMPDIF